MIRGSGKIVEACKKIISKKPGYINEDLDSSWIEVECLGACVNAPMVQINKDYYEDLTPEKAETILTDLKRDDYQTLDLNQEEKAQSQSKKEQRY